MKEWRGSCGGWNESHDRHLCSPRLHLTLYEPMKWLNHFTTDVYNAIDPYLFITPVHSVSSSLFSLFLCPSTLFPLFPEESNFPPSSSRLICRENKFNMCCGARRFILSRGDMGNFIAELCRLKLHNGPFRFYRRRGTQNENAIIERNPTTSDDSRDYTRLSILTKYVPFSQFVLECDAPEIHVFIEKTIFELASVDLQ